MWPSPGQMCVVLRGSSLGLFAMRRCLPLLLAFALRLQVVGASSHCHLASPIGWAAVAYTKSPRLRRCSLLCLYLRLRSHRRGGAAAKAWVAQRETCNSICRVLSCCAESSSASFPFADASNSRIAFAPRSRAVGSKPDSTTILLSFFLSSLGSLEGGAGLPAGAALGGSSEAPSFGFKPNKLARPLGPPLIV